MRSQIPFPVPSSLAFTEAELPALVERYTVETRIRLARLLTSVHITLIFFWIFFVITDLLLYADVLVPLLGLRVLLIMISLVGMLQIRRPTNSPIEIYCLLHVLAINGVLAIMIIMIGEPFTLYGMSLVGAMAFPAMLPLAMRWYTWMVVTTVLSYVTIMTIVGWWNDLTALQYLIGLIGFGVVVGVAHHLLERERWHSFLFRVQAEQLNQRLQEELSLARRIQRGLLPPARPTLSHADLMCWSSPAREVGGDFYAYAHAEQRIVIAVGDVSGKGLPAALLMSTSLAHLRDAFLSSSSPAALLHDLDHALADATKATRQNCALCVVEVQGTQVRVANAGGVPPLIRRADGRVEWLEATGLPLGYRLSLGYRDLHATLEASDLIFLVSDGVLEANNEAGELFGFTRLEQAVATIDVPDTFSAVAELREQVAQYMGRAEAHDDMTIVVLHVGSA
jgi:hypothetical protein